MDDHEHDRDCLRYAATTHIGYELRHVGSMAAAGANDLESVLAYTGVLEGFLVHLRNVDAFLANRGRERTDVVASNFLPGWPGRGFLSKKHRTSIHRKVAHITCDRNEHFSWLEEADRVAFAEKAFAAVDRFAQELEPVDREAAGWFYSAVVSSRQELEVSRSGAYIFKRV